MKLSPNLLQAITLGIAVSSMSSSCQQTDVNSGKTKIEKNKKGKTDQSGRTNCPACGMG